jgi:hypothetical protein
MSWATNSVSDALDQLGRAVTERCQGERLPAGVDVIRTPVALMFVRGDRAGPGASLAEQVVASFGYWNKDTAQYLDLVFFGWYKDSGKVGFQDWNDCQMFRNCVAEVEGMSKWRYSRETDALLVDFEMPLTSEGTLGPGYFSFANCIPLPVEKMIAEGQVRSLDAFVGELTDAAKRVYVEHPLQASVFEVSDRIGWTRGRRAVWDQLKHLFLRDWSRVYDELRYFAVCDLTLPSVAGVGTR